MKHRAFGRWSLLAIAAVGMAGLVAPKAAHAAGYKLQVVTSSKVYGGSQFQIGDLNIKRQFTFNIVGAEKDNGGGGEVTYFYDGVGAITRIQPSETKLSDGATLTAGNMWTPHGINDNGQVAYVADTDKSPHAIVVWDSNTKAYTLIAKNDTVVEGGTLTSAGVALEGRMVADINNRGQVVWNEGLTPADGSDATDAVFMFDPATNKITTIARKGTALPGGKQVLGALFPNIDEEGDVVFMANTADNENYGVYQWSGGNITAIAVPGQKVGDLTIAQFKLPRNAGEYIVMRGETVSSGGAAPVGEDTGVFVFNAGTLTKVIAPGDALPGGKFTATEPGGGRRAIGVNSKGQVVFKAVMEGDATGIFVWQNGQITPVITSGQKVEASGTVQSLVQGVGDQNGYHLGINENGDVAVSAVIDGAHSAVLATFQP